MTITSDQFDQLSEMCEFHTGRAWDGSADHLIEANARQSEVVEILEAHAEWLSATRAAVEHRGWMWAASTCREQSRRSGDLTTPPEWIGELSERLTPERSLNL
ncbi:hypothetical protein [Gordonia sp. NB41Y]|uniref:hypothetical protein n=1 Tax=Gordonia sp. NB41Y TaxID=875808 RepID=UPI00034A4204|nr:hypothetical protein [Gordonia sp. NB41Y]KOY49265.1 hypothetical protein ISGA_11150 [Gordonia sp. NB41Y]WLP91442.1 hypothetical protein Q9K23_04030 [Gordonia sp. NB41Y]